MEHFRQLAFPMLGKIWVFTGGAHAAGGFAENKGFRNAAGLFEEAIRWNMRTEDVASRENFVFNTARSGYNVCDIIREFHNRIAYYRPAAVVYIGGIEDLKLPPQTVRENIAELKRRTAAIGAAFIEMQAPVSKAGSREGETTDQLSETPILVSEPDSLKEANLLLEALHGSKLSPESADRNRLALKSSPEAFAQGGKLALSQNPMRWLFIGDSITHGALHTFGYDSLPQLWEKYIREDWNRRDDTVLNTAVSGATADEYLARLDVRYTPYADADVVVAMFGTNDCCSPDKISVEQFKRQLQTIVELARSQGSQIVLRTPQPQREDAKGRVKALVPFAQAVRDVALENNVILADHFRSFSILKQEHPDYFLALMSDAVHPNAQGQYRMFRELAYATGMVLDNSMVSMDYALSKP